MAEKPFSETDMFIESSQRDNYIVIEIEGRIGGKSSVEFYKEIKEIVADNDELDVIIDFSEVDFIDSSGLGSLVAINSHLLKNKRKLVLAGVMENLMALLKITNLHTILKIVDSVEDVFA